jgi:hypothetical protein
MDIFGYPYIDRFTFNIKSKDMHAIAVFVSGYQIEFGI